jgi:D-sedoheptulose 7-phosphate isomerase
MSYIDRYLRDASLIIERLDRAQIEAVIQVLLETRRREGRLFFLGVGGSAANASHAVNDFRKLAGFEAYAPTDNVSELTARTNDEGWETVFATWLKGSRVGPRDTVFVFSVGGGDKARNISANIVAGLDAAHAAGASIVGIVGRDGGHTARVADACVLVPTIREDSVTPQTEAFQAVIWHLIVSDPRISLAIAKWEGALSAS